MDRLEASHIGRDDIGDFSVNLIRCADGNLLALVEDVHFRDYEPFGGIDHVGVAQQWEIKPAATARTPSDGAVLLAACTEEFCGVTVDLRGERTFADTCNVSLRDANNGANLGGADACAGDRASSCR